jgi:hypothetical protein
MNRTNYTVTQPANFIDTTTFDIGKGYVVTYFGRTVTYEALRAGMGNSVGKYYKDSTFTIHGASNFNEHFLSADYSNYDAVFGNYNTQDNVWYRVEGIRKPDNTFVFNLYDNNGNLLDSFSGNIKYPNTNYNHLVLEGYNDWEVDYIFVRKYAPQEPQITTQNLGDYYKITIHNPNNYPLRNFQVKISNPRFITSKFEGLKITDKNPYNIGQNTQTIDKTAVIYIESEPSDANIFINGEYKGITPLKLQLKEGTYTIKIKKEGYKECTKKITLKAGDSKEISINLIKDDNSIILITGAVFGCLIVIGGGIYALNKRSKDKKKKEVIDELEELLKK